MTTPFIIDDSAVGRYAFYINVDGGAANYLAVAGYDVAGEILSHSIYNLNTGVYTLCGMPINSTIMGIYDLPGTGIVYLTNGGGYNIRDNSDTVVHELTANANSAFRFNAAQSTLVSNNGFLLDWVDPVRVASGSVSAINPSFYDINTNTYVSAPSAATYTFSDRIFDMILPDGSGAVYTVTTAVASTPIYYVKYNNGVPVNYIVNQVDGVNVWRMILPDNQPTTGGFLFSTYYTTSADNMYKIAKINKTTGVATQLTIMNGSTAVIGVSANQISGDGSLIFYKDSGTNYVANIVTNVVLEHGTYLQTFVPDLIPGDLFDFRMAGDWVFYTTYNNDSDIEVQGGINIGTGETWTIGGRPALEFLRLRELGYL